MRKNLLFFLLAFFAFFSAKADLLTVADGTDTSEYVPIYGYYCDMTNTTCQMIYPKTDLDDMAGGTISQIKFYPTEALNTSLAGCVLQLSLLEVDSDVFPSYNAITGTMAYGTYTIVGGETELVFNLTNSYEYSGDKHLLVETKVTTSSGCPHTYFYGVTQATGHYTGNYRNSRTNFLPKATFTYTPGTVLEYDAKVTPETYAFGKVALGETATTNIAIHNKGANAFTPSLSGLTAPFSTTYTPAAIAAGETVNVPVTFAPTSVGDYTATLTVDCGQAGTHQVALSGKGSVGIDLDVAVGTSTNNRLPFSGYHCDVLNTISQMIYPKTDLASMANGAISEIKFYPTAALDAALANCVLQISLKEVNNATFTSNSTITGAEICGTYTIAGGETEVVFELSNPFEYSGENNLLIETKVITKSGYKDTNFYGVSQTSAGLFGYTSSIQNFLPHATFTYTHVSHPYKAEVTPDALAFGNVNLGESSSLNVTIENKGTNAFTPSLSGLAAPFSTTYTPAAIAAGETVNVPVTFAPTTDGNFTGTLAINCGNAGTFDVALSGKGYVVGSEVVVCDGSATNTLVPVYGAWYDTQNIKSQFIYPAEMLTDLVGRKITTVKFFSNSTDGMFSGGHLQLSVKETEQATFTRESYSGAPDNPITGMTVVATIVPNANATELEFVFDEPFLYNGGNLAFETLVTQAGSYKSLSWYGENQTGNLYEAVAFNSKSNEFVNFLPKAYFESITNTPVAESVTLAELLSGGVNDKEYVISNDLAMANKAVAQPYAFLTDGNNNWIKVEYTSDLESAFNTRYIKGGTLKGTLSNIELNPVLTTTEAPESTSTAVEYTIAENYLNGEVNFKPNQVVALYGYWKDGKVYGTKNFTTGELSGKYVTLNTAWAGTVTLAEGERYILACAMTRNSVAAPSDAMHRAQTTDTGYTANVLNQPVVTGINAIDGNAIDGKVNVYNMQGQLIKRGVEAGVAAQGLPAGIYLIGNKKVVVK